MPAVVTGSEETSQTSDVEASIGLSTPLTKLSSVTQPCQLSLLIVSLRFRHLLTSVFFHHVQPYAAMVHRPTFLTRLYTRQVSPVLLDMMYALGARHCTQPALLASMPASKPAYLRGEVFAERANLAAKQCLHIRASWTRLQRDFDRGTYEETEFVQALYLLSIHYSGLDHPALADYFFEEAVAIIHPSPSSTINPPPNRLAISSSEYHTLTEIRHRTFWMVLLHDLTSTAAGNRPRRLHDHEIYNIPLPGDEASWLRYGAESRSGADRGRRDGIAVGTGNWEGEEGAVGEIGHVIRVVGFSESVLTAADFQLLVFHDIVSATGARHSSKSLSTANHEATLWVGGSPFWIGSILTVRHGLPHYRHIYISTRLACRWQ
jgi:hypothetical protein